MKLMISEVLRKAHNAKTKAAKIKILQDNSTQTLRSMFIMNFDDTLVSRIPAGDVPYKPNDAPKGTEHTLLEKEGKNTRKREPKSNEMASKTLSKTPSKKHQKNIHI